MLQEAQEFLAGFTDGNRDGAADEFSVKSAEKLPTYK
jgi:hypothetical protein